MVGCHFHDDIGGDFEGFADADHGEEHRVAGAGATLRLSNYFMSERVINFNLLIQTTSPSEKPPAP
jgi:hypothetical protein